MAVRKCSGVKLYSNENLDVVSYPVTIKGKRRIFLKINDRPVAVILPFIRPGVLILERQYRHALRKNLYEIPAGHADIGEPLKSAAARELKEETGFTAKRLTRLMELNEAPGIINCTAVVYVAEGLVRGKRALDEEEKISTMEVTLQKALSMIMSGKITDAKTIAAVLTYNERAKRKSY